MNVLHAFTRQNLHSEPVENATVCDDNYPGSHINPIKGFYRILPEFIKLSASSIISFVVDYSAYSILSLLTGNLASEQGLIISNVVARVISASLNFTLNRRWVFHSRAGVIRAALQYSVLAALILVGNTFFLSFLSGTLGINHYIAKLITEFTFFTMSWLTQHFIIFNRKEDGHASDAK